MKCVCLALGMAVLVPAAARGEPIPVSVTAASNGFSQSGSALTSAALNLGTIVMPGVNSVGMLLIDGPRTASDYVVSFMLEGIGSFDTLRLELLNPTDPSDRFDPDEQPAWMPKGYSTSNDVDGLSFAQSSGLERSAVFAGGGGAVSADEFTHRGDILFFSGLSGAASARITFAIRDRLSFFNGRGHAFGRKAFLLRITALDAVSAPEPASMLLLGAGLAGLAAARRRRRATSH